MAPKKRKGRKGARQRAPQNRPDAMSPHDPNAPQSTRPSTEGAMSVVTAGDDPPTAMTSLTDPEEGMADARETLEAEDDVETTSIYPASQFPRASSMYRTGGHFVPGDSRTIASDLASSTRSLWAMDLDYRDIHGRRYCREYHMPNDEIEQLRLTLQHQVMLHILDNELTLAPVQDPINVLDIGTGTGEWAIRFAELYPHCEVVGTDISAIAETQSVPVNVFFEIEDAEDWDRPPDHYDLIHFRWLEGAFKDWKFIYDSVYYSLKPGGWIEVQDFDATEIVAKFFSNFSPESSIHALWRDVTIASELSGRSRGVQHIDPRIFMNAGFVDIRVTEYAIPITVAEKSIGKIWLIACLDAIESICLRLLTEYMGWDPEECKAACEESARELANLARNPATSRKLNSKLRVIVARKPVNAPRSAALWPAFCAEHEGEERTSPCEPDLNGAQSSFASPSWYQDVPFSEMNGSPS